MTATLAFPGLDGSSTDAFIDAVAPLFEGAPRFLDRLASARPFGSAAELFARARLIAQAMPEAEQLELIDAHPRLGAPAGSVSALSFVEQGYDRSDADAAAEAERARLGQELARLGQELARLNAAYERRFGFRYCVFVAGRSRAALVLEISTALESERASEIDRALDAVVDIAADRYATLTAMSPEGATR
ncbi:MAG TPA: 2-oxo-4-hydroxy-4-carboxy-5-ureidoimidazoline decarboxylase [Candidatus Limnocylindrales bacterium]